MFKMSAAVACGSLLQSCKWLSPVRQNLSTEVHLLSRELFLVSFTACDKTRGLDVHDDTDAHHFQNLTIFSLSKV